MPRRRFISIVVAVAAVVSVAALDVLAAGSGILGRRNRSRRTYRSYSVSPGGADVTEGGTGPSGTAGVPRPAPASSRPRTSVPSYMRADSKAQGRFGP